MRKQCTAAFKAKLVLELLKEQKSLSQLAAEHKVHPNVLRQWREAALRELPTLFDKKDHNAESELYGAEISAMHLAKRATLKGAEPTLNKAHLLS